MAPRTPTESITGAGMMVGEQVHRSIPAPVMDSVGVRGAI